MSGTVGEHRPTMSEDYERAGFGARLGYGERPVVLVVDMVRGYLCEGEPFWAPGYASVLQATGTLVTAARDAGVPVIWTTLDFDPAGLDTGWFLRKVPSLRTYIERPELGLFHADLSPAVGELVITKQFASAFFGTALASALAHLRVDTVLVSGLSTSGCVRASAVDALQYGYRPIVVAEAVGDRDEAAHRQSLFDLEAKYADVEPLSSVIEHLAAG